MHHLVKDLFSGLWTGSRGEFIAKYFHDATYRSETIAAWRNPALLGGQTHEGTNQVVGGKPQVNFLGHHVWGAAGDLVEPQRGFQGAQIRFNGPAFAVEG